MVTIQETKTRDLNSPDEIVAYLQQRYGEMEASEFKPGEAVTLVSRAGLPQDFAVGDVAVFLSAVPNQPFASILCLNAAGREIAVQAQTLSLAKRTAA
jgi:hypothetical protein